MITSAPPMVLDSAYSRRKEKDEKDAMPIDTIAAGTITREVPAIVSKKTPRYRGAASVADTGNTGIISTLIMNTGDWVMFTGSGAWQTARLYEWRGKPEEGGEGWALLPIEENRWRYLDGINDLTDGAIEGVFSNAFINTLVAKTAIIERLFSELIVLHSQGVFQTEGFNGIDGGTPGVRITAATGLVEALSAFFRDITITGESTFSGRIDSGVLQVQPSSPLPFSLAANTNDVQAHAYVQTIRSQLGIPPIVTFTVYPTSGTYLFFAPGANQEVQENIRSITFEEVNASFTRIKLVSASGRSINYTDFRRLLSFTVGTSGLTLRLPGLPTDTGVTDEVYKKPTTIQGEYQLMIRNN